MSNYAQQIEFLISENEDAALGTATVYLAGTTILATIWTTRDKSVVAANPHDLNANGSALLYADGVVKVDVKDSAGVSVPGFPRDNLSFGLQNGPWVDISNYASLTAAITAIGSTETELLINSNTSLTASTTIPANVKLLIKKGVTVAQGAYNLINNGRIDNAGIISSTTGTFTQGITGRLFNNGGTLSIGGAVTVSGPFSSDLYQVLTGAGSLNFYSGSVPTVYPEWFGADADGDDSAAIIAALASLNNLVAGDGYGGKLYLSRLYNISEKISIPNNVRVVGKGMQTAIGFNIMGTFSDTVGLSIDGAGRTGGYAFRVQLENFTVYCNDGPATVVPILITDAYTCKLSDVFVLYAKLRGIDIKPTSTAVNDITLDRVSVYGVAGTTATHGIYIDDANGVRLNDCDVEVFLNGGVGLFGDSTVDINGLYAERNITAVYHNVSTSGSVTIKGGYVGVPNSSSIGVNIVGPNLTIIGGRYHNALTSAQAITTNYATAKPGNVHIKGARITGNAVIPYDPKNWIDSVEGDDYEVEEAGKGWISVRDVTNHKLDGATATGWNAFKVTGAYNGHGYVDIDLQAEVSDVPTTFWTGKYRFAFGADNGSMKVTTVTEYAKANLDGASRTLSIAVTAVATSATEITVTITPTVTGTVTTADMYVTAQMRHTKVDGTIYIEKL